jgi:hypothetical protein
MQLFDRDDHGSLLSDFDKGERMRPFSGIGEINQGSFYLIPVAKISAKIRSVWKKHVGEMKPDFDSFFRRPCPSPAKSLGTSMSNWNFCANTARFGLRARLYLSERTELGERSPSPSATILLLSGSRGNLKGLADRRRNAAGASGSDVPRSCAVSALCATQNRPLQLWNRN